MKITIKLTNFAYSSKEEHVVTTNSDSINRIDITVDNGRLYISLGKEDIYYNPSLMDGDVELIFEKPLIYNGGFNGNQKYYDSGKMDHNFIVPEFKEISTMNVQVDNGRFYIHINHKELNTTHMTDGCFTITD